VKLLALLLAGICCAGLHVSKAGDVWTEQKTSAPSGGNDTWYGSAADVRRSDAVIGADGDQSLAGARDGHEAPEEATPLLDQVVIANDGIVDDRFGTAVAVWGDTAFVSSAVWSYNRSNQNSRDVLKKPQPDANQRGTVYVFRRDNGVWTQTQKLLASDASDYSNFGSSLAFDGSTLMVAALNANVGDVSQQGAVYSFSFVGDSWIETEKFSASDGASSEAFGSAVAVQGTTAVIGALNATVGVNTSQGKAYIFTLADGIWSQRQILTAADGSANDRFGQSVAFDGVSILVGAPTLPYNQAHGGFVYAFESIGDAWSQSDKLVPDDTAVSDQFGYSVSLDGSNALIGSVGNQFARGSVYAFSRPNGAWQQVQKIMPEASSSGDQFGNAIAMKGSTALVGAQASATDRGRGRAFVLSEASGEWNLPSELEQVVPGTLDLFGTAVAFDGISLMVGAPGASVGENATQGEVYLFRNDATDAIFVGDFDEHGP
jgi:hypothetical protein